MGLYGILRTLSFYTVIKHIKKDFTFIKTVKNLLLTQFFNGVTPFSTGGQPAQIYFLKKEGIDYPTATSIVVQNFIIYQAVLIFYGLFALIMNYTFHFYPKVQILQWLVLLGFITNVTIILVMLILCNARKTNKFLIDKFVGFLTRLKIVKHRIRVVNKFHSKLDQFHNSIQQLQNNKKTFIKCILYNFVAFAVFYSIPVILLYSIGDFHSFTFFHSIVTCSYVMLVDAFIPVPGGTGGIEYAFMKFFGNFVTGSIISTVLLLWRFVTYYLGLIIGAIALNVQKRR